MNRLKILFFLFLCTNYSLCAADLKLPEQPMTLFCHGLGGNDHTELHTLLSQKAVHQPAKGFQMDNNQATCSLGHHHDVKALQDNIQENQKYILYGRSRGGATAINYIADHKPENIKALIIDAAPADIVNIVDEYQYLCGLFLFWTRPSKEWILRQFYPGYQKNSVPPVEKIAEIQDEKIKEMPILIAHSRTDKRVNIRSAWQNYKAFMQNGFKNVYLYELPQGRHHYNAKDAGYQQALQSFYKQHNFTHDENQATLQSLDHLQPSLEEIDAKLTANQWALRKQICINVCIATGITTLYIALKKKA